MSLKVTIKDGNGTDKEAHVHKRDDNNGVIVFTEPLIRREFTNIFAANDCFGSDMAIDVTASGCPVLVHDGIDSCLWTGSVITGTAARITFNSCVRANAGCNSVEMDNMTVGSIIQFLGCCSVNLACYVSLSMFINVDKDWAAGDAVTIYGWCSCTNNQVGTSVCLSSYFNCLDFDVWQSINIPLGDMCLQSSSVDSFRVSQGSVTGKAPKFYLDCIQIIETGSPVAFLIEPPASKIFSVNTLLLTFTDTFAGTVTGGTMPGYAYNKILGVSSLTNGISIQFRINGESAEGAVYAEFGDFVREGFSIKDVMSDGTVTLVAMRFEFSEPLRLQRREEDHISITISDNISGLDSFTALAIGCLEDEL